MVFKGPAGYQRVIYIIMNLVIGLAVNLVLSMLVTKTPITTTGLVQGIALSFFIGYSVSDLVPAMAWGQTLAAKLKIRNPLGTHFVSSLVLTFFMATLILFFCALINILTVAGLDAVIGFFLMAYPLVFVVVYAIILVFVPIGAMIAKSISGFDPSQQPQQ